MTIQEPRSTFGPESLTRFSRILEDVMVDLIGDGVPAVEVRSIETRSKLSHMLLGFARSWWTDTQQLLGITQRDFGPQIRDRFREGGLARERSTGRGWLALWLPWRR